ncbi:MAG: helix-turn-helix transcriptional regulator [Verrucomicrobia bacterium]|nr:helix-turn-helix transcriptional regulator [Verrucomicrobiota bacterium]
MGSNRPQLFQTPGVLSFRGGVNLLPTEQAPPKPLMDSVKTIGDWIKANRQQKNLTPGHVASKMGIAHALVLSWENNASVPDSQQWASLARVFGLGVDALVLHQNH